MSPDTLLAILAMAAATYATRIGGVLVGAQSAPDRPREAGAGCLARCGAYRADRPGGDGGHCRDGRRSLAVLAATRLPMIVAIGIGIASVALLRGLS